MYLTKRIRDYQRYVVMQWGWGNILTWFNDTATQVFIHPGGSVIQVFSHQLLQSTFMHAVLHDVAHSGLKAMLGGLMTTFIALMVIYRYLSKRGAQQTQTKQIRGDEITDLKTIKKFMKRDKFSDIHIAGLTLPAKFEVRHVLVHGTYSTPIV